MARIHEICVFFPGVALYFFPIHAIIQVECKQLSRRHRGEALCAPCHDMEVFFYASTAHRNRPARREPVSDRHPPALRHLRAHPVHHGQGRLLLRRVLGRRHLRHLPALSGRGSMGAPARSARSPAQHPAPDAAARPKPAGLQALSRLRGGEVCGAEHQERHRHHPHF